MSYFVVLAGNRVTVHEQCDEDCSFMISHVKCKRILMDSIQLYFIDNCCLARTSNTAVIYCKAVSCLQHAACFGPKGLSSGFM